MALQPDRFRLLQSMNALVMSCFRKTQDRVDCVRIQVRRCSFVWFVFGFTAFLHAGAHATTYRWVDQNGKVQYSDVMPPSMAGQGHSELDKQGRVVREVQRTRMTEEERRLQKEMADRRKEEQRRRTEQDRRDKALLSTYATEKEIALARDRALELESLNIQGLQTRMDRAASKLAEANAQISSLRNAGRTIPANMTQMRSEAQRELAQISTAMNQRIQAVDEIHRRFEEDEKRFLELKSIRR
jgi:hypothetical protein